MLPLPQDVDVIAAKNNAEIVMVKAKVLRRIVVQILMEKAEVRNRARQTKGTSDLVPRSGCDLQPRVAAAATLGKESGKKETPRGLRLLVSSKTCHNPVGVRTFHNFYPRVAAKRGNPGL